MCQALGIPVHIAHMVSLPDDDIGKFFTQVGYTGNIARLGLLTRPGLRREWNFFFDCIERAFTAKCSNFDAITQMTQQIGYSLIFGYHYDFGRNLLTVIGDRITYDKTKIYYS